MPPRPPPPATPPEPRFRFSIPFTPSRKHANVVFAIVDPDLEIVSFRPGDFMLSFDMEAKVLTIMGRGKEHARPAAKGAPVVALRSSGSTRGGPSNDGGGASG
jgi:hypothetical protein